MTNPIYTLPEVEKKLKASSVLKNKKCIVINETARKIRVELPENNASMRKEITTHVMGLFKNAITTASRPFDVFVPSGPASLIVLVKPGSSAKKTASKPYYGFLDRLDLNHYTTTAFAKISASVATAKIMPPQVKEKSDWTCVSEFNTAIEPLLYEVGTTGLNLSFLGFTFNNVIGCIPVTEGEPKADAVLVALKGNALVPVCYFSYKLGTTAKGFQNYSGMSEKSAPGIFSHRETFEFYSALETISHAKMQQEIAPYRRVKSRDLIRMSVWGMDFNSGTYGVNNCHFIAQGAVTLSKTTIRYTGHSTKNANTDGLSSGGYAPVFGARYTNRNNRGPGGMTIAKYRIGIFPEAYFTDGRSKSEVV